MGNFKVFINGVEDNLQHIIDGLFDLKDEKQIKQFIKFIRECRLNVDGNILELVEIESE